MSNKLKNWIQNNKQFSIIGGILLFVILVAIITPFIFHDKDTSNEMYESSSSNNKIYKTKITEVKADSTFGDGDDGWTIKGTTTAPDKTKIVVFDPDSSSPEYPINFEYGPVKNGKFSVSVSSSSVSDDHGYKENTKIPVVVIAISNLENDENDMLDNLSETMVSDLNKIKSKTTLTFNKSMSETESENNDDSKSVYSESNKDISSSEASTKPIPVEYKSALNKAKFYGSQESMSKAGIYDQLTSEAGEQFSAEAAQYAIDNLDADYNKNALKKAKKYQDDMSMSPAAIQEQLTSDDGEKFTPEEAAYAIQHLND